MYAGLSFSVPANGERLLTPEMQRLCFFKRLLCIRNCFAGLIPCGKLYADVVVLQTDAGVTQLKQGQHLPCGALVSSHHKGEGRQKKTATACAGVFVCSGSR